MERNGVLCVNSLQTESHCKYIKTQNLQSSELINSLLVFFLMYFSNDTYLFGTNSNSFYVSLPRYILLLFCLFGLVYVIKIKSIQEHKKRIAMYCILMLTFVIVSLINHENTNRTINKALFMTGGLLLCIILDYYAYSIAYRNAMLFISISSNILWILAYLVPDLVMNLPQIQNTVGVRFATIYFAGLDLRTINSATIRNGGIFWEPGVYQIFLNLAVLFELFIEERPRKRYLFAYCVALLSTFSTTGYIAFFWMILMYIIFGGKIQRISKGSRWMLFLPIITIILFFAITGTTIGRQVFGKASNLNDGTTMVRFASFFASIDIARLHPLSGVGMERVGDYMYQITVASDFYHGWTRQNSNTLLYQFAAHGCIFGGLFLAGTSFFGRVFKRGNAFAFFVFILISIFYMGENLMVSILPYVIIFYGIGLSNDLQNRKDNILNECNKSRYFIY